MAEKKKKKPMLKFPRRMQKKLLVMFGIIACMLVGLIARIMYIEYTSGEKYEKIVLSQQEYDSKIIPYQRGDIVDSKGTVMATSIAVYNVILDCSVLTSDEDYIEPTISALVQCFPELTEDQLYGYVRDKADSRYIVLIKKASYDEIQPFVEMQEAEDEKGRSVNPNIKGVWFEKEYQREYPYGSLASSVIGFTAAGNVGVNGLENYYNDTLKDSDTDDNSLTTPYLGTIGLTAQTFQDEIDTTFKEMALSVALNGGFYVGRYELSLSDSGTALSKVNSPALKAGSTKTTKIGEIDYTTYKSPGVKHTI